MLKITVIAAGRLKERFWRDACAEYLKRLGGYAKVRVVEVADSTPEREEADLLAAIEAAGAQRTILLDVAGTETSSEQLAKKLDALALHGASHVAFVVGGSEGVTRGVQDRCDERLSFGPVTLPHNLARVVLLEQLYRACRINRGEPYHK